MTYATIADPAVNGLPRDLSNILILSNINELIPVPQSVVAGIKNFTVTVASQPRQDITNPASGVYIASLGGIPFSVPKLGGTVSVNVPVVPGQPIYLIHTLNYFDVNLKPTFDILFGTNTPVTVPTLSSGTAMEVLVPKIVSVEPTGGWIPSTASNVCTNPVNAIRGVTATVTQSAFSIDSVGIANGSGNISFTRPNADRIVFGAYAVAFAVNLNNYGGQVILEIGNTVVYAADLGQVIYQWTPAAIELDTDVDVLTVKLSGGIGVVSVNITSASRTVGTGNLDSSGYATLLYPATRYFRALQVDQNPNLGKITSAKLAIEWFGNGIIPANTCQVKWDGRVVGYLSAQSVGGGSINKTVTATVTSQGNSNLSTGNISTVVTGGTSSLTRSTFPRNAIVSSILVPVPGATFAQRGWCKAPAFTGRVGNITARATFVSDTITNCAALYIQITFKRADGSVISGGLNNNSFTLTSVGTNTWETVTTLTEEPASLFIERSLTNLVELSSVTFEWNSTISSTELGHTSVAASGGTTVPNGILPNSGISVSTSGGTIQLTIPESPRTTITEFDLPDVTEWYHMTGKTVEIELLNTSPSVQLVQVQLAVDYNSTTNIVPDVVTATVIGLSSNPADVINLFTTKMGEILEPTSFKNFRDWADTNNYIFARRIENPTDALQLRQYALDQSHAILVMTSDGMKVIRLLDMTSPITEILETDLFEPVNISWSTRVETQITLRYAEDYSGTSGFLSTLNVNETNNKYCFRGKNAILVDTPMVIEAGFIRDDVVAQMYLNDYCRLYSQPSRIISLVIPFTFKELENGDLIMYNLVTWRITELSRFDGYITIKANEVPPI